MSGQLGMIGSEDDRAAKCVKWLSLQSGLRNIHLLSPVAPGVGLISECRASIDHCIALITFEFAARPTGPPAHRYRPRDDKMRHISDGVVVARKSIPFESAGSGPRGRRDTGWDRHVGRHRQWYPHVTSEKERWLLCKSHNVGCPDETLDKGEPAVDIT